MDIRKLQRAIVDGLEDVKAQDIVVFNTEHLTSMFERVIVASGTSNRQTKALASSVREAVKSRGMPVLSTEGADNGEWIIVDCGAAVAHIMQPSIRAYYRLEELWGDKPVRIKLDAAQAKALPKAEVAEPVRKRAVVAAAATHGAQRKASARTAKTAKPAPRKPATRRSAAGKTTAGRPVTRKSVAAKSTGRKTQAAKSARRSR
jgi:ribosome-associated protein